MLRMSIDSLKSGMTLGKGIFSEDGRLLLGRGVAVNTYFINRLKDLGINSIFIHDESTEDVIPVENISEMVRGSTLRHMKELFGSLDELGREMKSASISAINDAVSSDQFQNTFRNHPAFMKIQEDASQIVDQLLAGEVVLGLNSLKTYDNYTFQHSIDVAIVSIMIGRKVGFPAKRLRELGIGCILHDIGKTFVPKEILDKPGKLTPEEFERMKSHPRIGFELMRGVETIGVLPPHIAFQHHEKQNGTGYPRGLTGDNRMDISEEPRTIHLYGSIAAVADIYDALSSDRPYRKALPPEEVISTLRSLAGEHLNRDILKSFLAITPVFPIGNTVRVIKGKYLFFTGIVARLNPTKLDRPFVRLVIDKTGKRINPIDIDLVADEETDIISVIL